MATSQSPQSHCLRRIFSSPLLLLFLGAVFVIILVSGWGDVNSTTMPPPPSQLESPHPTVGARSLAEDGENGRNAPERSEASTSPVPTGSPQKAALGHASVVAAPVNAAPLSAEPASAPVDAAQPPTARSTADCDDIHLNRYRVWLSLTTTPARIANVPSLVASLELTGIHRVIVNVPRIFSRTGETYPQVPELWGASGTPVDPRIVVNHLEKDWGPLTKWAGLETAPDILPWDIVIVIDDDILHSPKTLSRLVSLFLTAEDKATTNARFSLMPPPRGVCRDVQPAPVVLGGSGFHMRKTFPFEKDTEGNRLNLFPDAHWATQMRSWHWVNPDIDRVPTGAAPPPAVERSRRTSKNPKTLTVEKDRLMSAHVVEAYGGCVTRRATLTPGVFELAKRFASLHRLCWISDDVVISAALAQQGASLTAVVNRFSQTLLAIGLQKDALQFQHGGNGPRYFNCSAMIDQAIAADAAAASARKGLLTTAAAPQPEDALPLPCASKPSPQTWLSLTVYPCSLPALLKALARIDVQQVDRGVVHLHTQVSIKSGDVVSARRDGLRNWTKTDLAQIEAALHHRFFVRITDAFWGPATKWLDVVHEPRIRPQDVVSTSDNVFSYAPDLLAPSISGFLHAEATAIYASRADHCKARPQVAFGVSGFSFATLLEIVDAGGLMAKKRAVSSMVTWERTSPQAYFVGQHLTISPVPPQFSPNSLRTVDALDSFGGGGSVLRRETLSSQFMGALRTVVSPSSSCWRSGELAISALLTSRHIPLLSFALRPPAALAEARGVGKIEHLRWNITNRTDFFSCSSELSAFITKEQEASQGKNAPRRRRRAAPAAKLL
jgi:hypothetical protein